MKLYTPILLWVLSSAVGNAFQKVCWLLAPDQVWSCSFSTDGCDVQCGASKWGLLSWTVQSACLPVGCTSDNLPNLFLTGRHGQHPPDWSLVPQRFGTHSTHSCGYVVELVPRINVSSPPRLAELVCAGSPSPPLWFPCPRWQHWPGAGKERILGTGGLQVLYGDMGILHLNKQHWLGTCVERILGPGGSQGLYGNMRTLHLDKQHWLGTGVERILGQGRSQVSY